MGSIDNGGGEALCLAKYELMLSAGKGSNTSQFTIYVNNIPMEQNIFDNRIR